MEHHHKESTHNNKKVLTGCPDCWEQSTHCQRCQGVCIFSLAFLESCQFSKKNRKILQAKCFKEDFDMIREDLLEEGTFDAEEDEYEILKAFHKSKQTKFDVWKKHNPYDIRLRTRSNKARILMSDYKMKGRCRWHRKITSHKPSSIYDPPLDKSHQKRNFVKAQEDFVLDRY